MICAAPKIPITQGTDEEDQDKDEKEDNSSPPKQMLEVQFFVHDIAEVATIQPRRNQNVDSNVINGTSQ